MHRGLVQVCLVALPGCCSWPCVLLTHVYLYFVEDECYQMATEFQETSLRPDISVTCA